MVDLFNKKQDLTEKKEKEKMRKYKKNTREQVVL